SIDGVIIDGDSTSDFAARSVSAAGDINGDGIDDFIVNSPFGGDNASGSGEAYVIFGKTAGALGTQQGNQTVIDLTNLDPLDGFLLRGQSTGDNLGFPSAPVGDVNSDGFDDIIVSAVGVDNNGNADGAAFVLFGKNGSDFGTVGIDGRRALDVTDIAPEDGFVISGDGGGADFFFLGRSVGGGGDVNGDGIDDVIVSMDRDGSAGLAAGAALVIFGRQAEPFGDLVGGQRVIDSATVSADQGFLILGDRIGDNFGSSVAIVGDMNGDGIDDIAVGAPGGDDAGEAYVIFGQSDCQFGSPDAMGRQVIDLSAFNESEGLRFRGEPFEGNLGESVASAGDVNADGFADLIVGSIENDFPNFSADVRVVLGGTEFDWVYG
ncbi:MAG: integrin alpha, partial [Pseudomonadota bacterium]